jgi:hypothetical protein
LVSPDDDQKPDRVWICVDPERRALYEMVSDSLDALRILNYAYLIFVHGARLTEVICDEEGCYHMRLVNADAMCGFLDRAANYFVYDREGRRKRTFPPQILINQTLSRPSAELGFWRLIGISPTPLFRQDGSVLLLPKPAYDPETGYFLALAQGLAGLDVPSAPGKQDIDWAKTLLSELLQDFCFEPREACYANALAALLTPLLRLILGSAAIPVLLIDAPISGSGKSLLAKVISIIATGRVEALITAPSSKEAGEWRKRISALLLAGHNLVIVDNIPGEIESADLCAAITSANFGDRLLGENTFINPRSRCQWILTGNSLRPQAELGRRSYRITLDPHRPDPQRRTDIVHDDLEEAWVPENRATILRALLILVSAWFAAGCPPATKIPPAANFTRWAKTIGAILEHAGISGFLGNGAFDSNFDSETEEWYAFLVVIAEVTYGDPFTAGDIETKAKELTWNTDQSHNEPSSNAAKLLAAIPGKLLSFLDRPNFRHALGTAFRDRKGRCYGDEGIYLDDTGKRPHGSVLWQIKRKIDSGGTKENVPAAGIGPIRDGLDAGFMEEV